MNKSDTMKVTMEVAALLKVVQGEMSRSSLNFHGVQKTQIIFEKRQSKHKGNALIIG